MLEMKSAIFSHKCVII